MKPANLLRPSCSQHSARCRHFPLLFVSTNLVASVFLATGVASASQPESATKSAKSVQKQSGVAPTSAIVHGLAVEPKQIELIGNFARAQFVVSAAGQSGTVSERSPDLTSDASFVSSDSKVVRVDPQGALFAVGNGTAEIVVALKAARTAPAFHVLVTVKDVSERPTVHYTRDIVPIISKAGCNMGACHASQYGKAGFKLSVFGYDPSQDYQAIVRDRSQRRVNFLEPEQSLLLKKPTLQVPHGGGRRMKLGSTEFETFAAWIASGAPGPSAPDAQVPRIVVTPARRISTRKARQQLRVDALLRSGSLAHRRRWVPELPRRSRRRTSRTPSSRASFVGRRRAAPAASASSAAGSVRARGS